MRLVDDGGRCRRSSRDGTPVLISVGRGGGAVDCMRRVKDGMVVVVNDESCNGFSEIFG
jgi:hypothetical protein